MTLPSAGGATVAGVVLYPGCLAIRDGGVSTTWEYGDPTGHPLMDALNDVETSAVALDLTDATGRAHAAWWLMGVGYGAVGGIFRVSSPFGPSVAVACYGWPNDAGYASAQVPGHPVGTIVPSLADLDPDDPRLLPDRFRWVDAEALRRVVLHTAGVAL